MNLNKQLIFLQFKIFKKKQKFQIFNSNNYKKKKFQKNKK